jgi:hypothetical protein
MGYQLLVYVDDVIILSGSMHTVKNTEYLVPAGKGIGV